MKKILLFLIASLCLQADILDYSAAIEYQYDSNIGQNITEESGSYFIPELKLKLTPWEKPGIFFRTDFAFDAYVDSRDYDDNSPLFDGGIGIDLGSKRLRYTAELSVQHYFGMNLYTDDHGEPRDWVPVLRTWRVSNDFRKQWDSHRIDLFTDFSILEYGDESTDSGSVKNEDDGVLVEITPRYRFKFGSTERAFSFKRLESYLTYEQIWTHKAEKSYWRLKAGIATKISIGHPYLDLETWYGYKRYLEEREHNQTGIMEIPTVHYGVVKGALIIPIVSDLSVYLGGDMRFRSSNYPSYEYNRHTAYVGIQWDSSVKRGGKDE